ncbi:hypothetical protein TVAG_156670 [Trichomonas vaginalis G3]|uniref:DUF3447 domain-containing protein n=1 Tax=Trichomonas vaginalis (strain ATCC PRA-98 / G3) TaxID=412133 RepID=A2FRT9_TRIV3|nr:proteasome regulatory particle assembly [Trichomonas vaginalis G3]EAX92388.1 hypothetical protein TVAG_156670 [Trichomonas vaginalis G3]KAI5544563.1 proteasome regulatory particle assembly [Trichomonas vaginalis G3]|eukprot:XP_001305318.1 hypothetical protein [Trichomonas vaginalis G3]
MSMDQDIAQELTGADLIRTYADYIDTMRSIYQLTDDKVESTFIKVKEILINKYHLKTFDILIIVENCLFLRDRYMKAYLKLYDLINSLKNNKINYYHVNQIKDVISAFENNKQIPSNSLGDFYEFLKPKSLFNSIMNDDLETMIYIVNQPGFDINIKMEKRLFHTKKKFNLLEVCSYYGSEKCYLYLRQNHNFEPSDYSIALSFLGGNPRIIQESLPLIDSSNISECVEYAIVSHNIDFFNYLNNNFPHQNIRYIVTDYYNLEAFLIAIDSGQISSFDNNLLRFNIDDLLVYVFKKFKRSAVKKFDILHAIYLYKIPKTIICAIESGANITITDSFNGGALHLAAKYKLKEVAEHLISHGLDIYAKNERGETPLHYAAGKSLDMVEFLISHGAKERR